MSWEDELSKCRVLADWLDLYLLLARNRPAAPHGPTEAQRLHQIMENEVVDSIHRALLHYNTTCVHRGHIWWTHNRPRVGLVNHVPYKEAKDLTWPVQPPPAPPATPPLPEKSAGFISDHYV